jgi:hypothetical protein
MLDIAAVMSGVVPLQQSSPGGALAGLGLIVGLIVMFAVFLIPAVGMWKTFDKADKPGWGAFIPLLNIFYLIEIADKPTWFIILFVIPVVNLLAAITVFIDVAKNFNKGAGYGLGLTFLPFIFWPVLGFGDAKYVGDTSAGV